MVKHFPKSSLLLLLLLPSYHHKAKALDNPVEFAAGVIGALAAGAGGAYLWLTWHKQDKKLISQTKKLCDSIDYHYAEEFELINSYEKTRYCKNPTTYKSADQENLRKDLVERTLGREIAKDTEKPLHYQEQILNVAVIRNLSEKIKAIIEEIKLIDKKLPKVLTTSEKNKLQAQRKKLVEMKDRCELLKKKAETIRGALMMSRQYYHESKVNTKEPRINSRHNLGHAPHPSQQQDAQKKN